MKDSLAIVAAIITVLSIGPYVIDIVHKKTKPNIVSWITWSLLTGIATAASFTAHERRTGILLLSYTICTITVVLLGIKHGRAKFTMFDGICQLGAVVGLVLWLTLNSPSIAIVATVSIDFVGALPTIHHAYKNPGEETWQTFLIATLAPILTIISLSSFSVASVLYPVYLAIADGAIVLTIIVRRKELGISLSRHGVAETLHE